MSTETIGHFCFNKALQTDNFKKTKVGTMIPPLKALHIR